MQALALQHFFVPINSKKHPSLQPYHSVLVPKSNLNSKVCCISQPGCLKRQDLAKVMDFVDLTDIRDHMSQISNH